MPRQTRDFHRRLLTRVTRFTPRDLPYLDALLADSPPCRGQDLRVFFPDDGIRFVGQELADERARVERVCRGCPVSDECLAAALIRGEAYGSWGGVTQPDFQALRELWRRNHADQASLAGGEAR